MLPKGAFNNYVDRILPFFVPSPPLRGQFLYPELGQKLTFFDLLPPKEGCNRGVACSLLKLGWVHCKLPNLLQPSLLPPHLVHVVIECPLMVDVEHRTCYFHT